MTKIGRGQQWSTLVAIAAICCVISSVAGLCSQLQQQRGFATNANQQISSPFSFNTKSDSCLSPGRRVSFRVLSLSSNDTADKNDEAPPKRPRALGTLQVPTLVGGITAAVIIRRILATTSNRLFQQHVIGAVMGSLVFLPAAVRSVQSRLDAVQAMKQDSATTRRCALIQHIKAHFYLTYGAALSAVVSLGSIFYNKMLLGKPHFTSLHSRLGLLTMALWASAYLVAQKKVWTPLIKKRKFVPPQLLWASKWHRQLGKAAATSVLVTTATGVGLSAWGQTAFGTTALTLVVGAIFFVAAALVLPPRK